MAIEIGDKIPAFTLPDQTGQLFDAGQYIGKCIMVIYFYPKNFTPGCTKEACQFRGAYASFENLKVKLVGVSGDSSGSHRRFAQKFKLPFVLCADENQELRRELGVKPHLLGLVPGRETLVVDKKGVLRFRFHQLKAAEHVNKALAFVKLLQDEN